MGIILALSACGGETAVPSSGDRETAPDSAAPALPSVELIDPAIPPAVAGEDGWDYHQSTDVDLTGDGEPELVVLTARVEMYRGRPAWDDGQPWQVYVEAQDTTRTYVYAQQLQIGTLVMRVSRSDEGKLPTIVLIEHLPDRLRIMEAWYPPTSDSLSIAMRFERNLDPRGDTASPHLP